MPCSFIAGIGPAAPLAPLAPLDDLADAAPPPRLDDLPSFDVAPAAEAAPAAPDAEGVAEVATAATDAAPYSEGQAPAQVTQMLNSSGNIARSAQSRALSAIELLSRFQGAFTPLTAGAIPATSTTLAPLGEAPQEIALQPDFASAPAAPLLAPTVAFEVGAAPDYAVAEIDLMDIPLPDPLAALLPAAPELDVIGVAVEPDFVLPSVPTLTDLALPDAPTLSLPLLEAASFDAPDAPNLDFAYANAEYGSALLSSLNRTIATLVADMTHSGIAPQVEQAIWERAADREALLTHRATGEAVRLLRCRGFALPEPTMVRIVQQALQGGLNRAAGLQREVAIEQARLRQSNFKFALDTSVALEARMMEKHNAAQARALEAAKATVLAEIQIFNGRIQLYAADVAAFGMKASAFRARLEAALARIGVFKAELEAQRVIGEINSQRVLIYKAQIDGVRAIVDTFKSRVDAAKTQIAGTKSTVEAYRSRIAAYEAQVTAKMADYDAYAARVRGQTAKVQLFGKQIDAYKTRVGAFDSLLKAQVGAQTLRFKQANEFPLELYKAGTDAYRIGVSASVEQLRAIASQFSTRIKAFGVAEGAKADHVEAELKQVATVAEAALASANLLLAAGQQNMQLAESCAGIAQSNLRSAGQLTGQLTASAMAAQSVHASISESGSFGTSNSASASSANSTSQAAVTSIGSSSATNIAHSSTNGTSNSSSLTNNSGRSYNRGLSNTFSKNTAVHNSVGVSVSNSNSESSSYTSSVSGTTECTDRTTHKE